MNLRMQKKSGLLRKKGELYTLLCSMPVGDLSEGDIRLKETLSQDEHVQYVISLSETIRAGSKNTIK